MTCNCIEVVNDKLKERNMRLALPIIFSFKGEPAKDQRVLIHTEQIEKGRGKAKAVAMFPTYCPFCGVQHGAEPKPSAEADLLAALRDIITPHIDEDGIIDPKTATVIVGRNAMDALILKGSFMTFLERARAAIAKAEGRL